MIIQCTKKLLDQLKIDPQMMMQEDPFMSWHANLLTVNRRKTVVLVNDQSRYVIVLYGLKAKDFKKMDEIILRAIEITFKEVWIKNEVIEQFIQLAPTVTYTKTKNRTLVARMNKACDMVYFWEELFDANSIYQPAISRRISRGIVGDGFYPNEAMYKDLEELAGFPIIQTKALQMKIALRFENILVFRRIVVPIHITFRHLHHIIQAAFQWQDTHLHEFYLYETEKSNQPYSLNHPAYDGVGYRPILNLVCDEEAFSYGDEEIPMKMDTSMKLSDYPAKKLMYVYDFGDNWVHDITIEKVIEDYDKNYPTCLEGGGNTPPEDVGGEGEYEEFLAVMSDVNHPEHQHMKTWAKSQFHQDFNLETVNRRLKFLSSVD